MWRIGGVILFLVFTVNIWASPNVPKPQLSITYVVYDNTPYWNLARQVAIDSARDLGVSFAMEFIDPAEDDAVRRAVMRVLNRLCKVDHTIHYIVLPGYKFGADDIFKKGQDLGVRFFFYSSSPAEAKKMRSGSWSNVIGALVPNDEQAGYQLAKSLILEARQRKIYKPDETPHIIGFGSWKRDNVNTDRYAGLLRAAREEGAVIDQYFMTRWDAQLAVKQAKRALKMYPNSKIFWTAADHLSLALVRDLSTELRESVVGGIDWLPEAVTTVEEGNSLAVTVGGHVFDLGWITTIIYDYHHGVDFADLAPDYIFKSKMHPLTLESVHALQKTFPNFNFSKLNFKSYSRYINHTSNYQFDLIK